ncbi:MULTISPECIES: HNH endonuclease signature motif containing protein [unclassified Microbacterium]|uniref:HNH endonuclease signature motif containing protein n=1 Tax=unclassified Microbacterium TaxID=2609290 RepID=UPI001D7A8C1B|nr:MULTISPECIES: HNH endonuclease signature motif containing protein [unclassified Microbacterium]CAH0139052.1 hypothetical protein SRABI121_00970 [Microbacterium sp. Bi121]HWK77379.1 HNH endonuclease signature motif containing protein [Microbacterium sp.]
MAFFTDITDRISAMRDLVGECAEAEELPDRIESLADESVISVLREANEIVQAVEQMSLVASGVISRRSRREAGHSGLAQTHGHRNATSLIQDITGTSRADAVRQSRVGESLLDAEEETPSPGESPDGERPGDGADENAIHMDAAAPARWDEPLRTALFKRVISNQQHDAIRRGLGEPPTPEGAAEAVIHGFAAHHIDPFSEGGRTDIDRGILLCRFHHMEPHHGQWRILRDGTEEFRLRHRSGEEHELRPRAVLAYAWAGIDPPPKRFRPEAA